MPGTLPQTVCLLEMRKKNSQTPKSNPYVSRHGVEQPEFVSNWEVWHVSHQLVMSFGVLLWGVCACVHASGK
jgi:hypothetical protein